MVCGLVVFLLGLYLGHQSVSKLGPLFECFAQLLEFKCVESEGSVVPLVRLTILGPIDRVHK